MTRLPERLALARAQISARRAWVQARRPKLEALGLEPWRPAQHDAPSWHRLPLRCSLEAVRRAGLGEFVQSPHPLPLWELPMFAKADLQPHPRPPHLLLRLDDLGAIDAALGLNPELP